jgi:hypothetical protein
LFFLIKPSLYVLITEWKVLQFAKIGLNQMRGYLQRFQMKNQKKTEKEKEKEKEK